MGYYHTAQICIKGHMINSSYNKYSELNKKFCTKCGVKTITACSECNSPIHGTYDSGLPVIGFEPVIDSYCYNCGNPYPWTKLALEKTEEIISEDECLSQSEKQKLVELMPDLVSETPSTNLAVIKLKKFLSISGKFTADALR